MNRFATMMTTSLFWKIFQWNLNKGFYVQESNAYKTHK